MKDKLNELKSLCKLYAELESDITTNEIENELEEQMLLILKPKVEARKMKNRRVI